MSVSRILLLPFALAMALLGASCETTLSPAQEAQMALIRAEPRGNHYIGRRYFTEKTRFWGYLRRPGESWEKSRLVVMNEDVTRTPDRLPERPRGAHGYGFDHNYQYKITGRYTGDTVYDPNANMFLPEFRLESTELISANPGWLFSPNEGYDPRKLPKKR